MVTRARGSASEMAGWGPALATRPHSSRPTQGAEKPTAASILTRVLTVPPMFTTQRFRNGIAKAESGPWSPHPGSYVAAFLMVNCLIKTGDNEVFDPLSTLQPERPWTQ